MKITKLTKVISAVNFIVIVTCIALAYNNNTSWELSSFFDIFICCAFSTFLFVLDRRYFSIENRVMKRSWYIFLLLVGMIMIILQNALLYLEIVRQNGSMAAATASIAAYIMFSNAYIYEIILKDEKGREHIE